MLEIKHKGLSPKTLASNKIILIAGPRVSSMKNNKESVIELPRGTVIKGKILSILKDKRGHPRANVDVTGLFVKSNSGITPYQGETSIKLPSTIHFWIYRQKIYLHDPWAAPVYKDLTKGMIWDYYHSIWPEIKKELLGHNLTLMAVFNKDPEHPKKIRNYPGTDEPILIRSFADLDELIFNHAIEIIPDLQRPGEYGLTRRGVIDVDSEASLDITKRVVMKIHDRLKALKYKPYLVSTASRAGFHVRFDLTSPVDALELKQKLLKDVIFYLYDNDPFIKEHILNPSNLNPSREFKKKSKKIFLDLAPLKARGGIKAIGSINMKTLGIAKLVPVEKLKSFTPRFNEILEWKGK